MAKKNFYAAIFADHSKIYKNWTECSAAVRGVSGVRFKGFETRKEAEAFVSGFEDVPEEQTDTIYIYVDGSFSDALPYAGWGMVVVKNNQEVFSQNGRTPHKALSRNIDGELEGAHQAIDWAFKNKIAAVICHDYEGIARWALGDWKANSQVAKNYQKAIETKLSHIRFCKIAAHTGNKWNERADELAKQALES
jgi:ribonuclease HI